MKLNDIKKKKLAIYFDATGAGRGPEMIAGPFDTAKLATDYANEQGWKLTGDDYFLDDYRADMDR